MEVIFLQWKTDFTDLLLAGGYILYFSMLYVKHFSVL